VRDIRETRVYQEAKEEGFKEGFERGLKKGIEEVAAIARLAAGNKSIEEIAAILELDVEMIREVLAAVRSLLAKT
jgi:predicted transposase YdaD